LTHLARDSRAQAVFQLVYQNSGADDDLAPLASAHERERCGCLTQLTEIVDRAIVAAQLPADTDPALAAHALHAYVSGLMQAWVREPAAYDLAAAAPALIDAMLTGLRAAPPRRAAQAGAVRDAAD
jgi:TetR/AcrR family acrAB operon transcriptional repressor